MCGRYYIDPDMRDAQLAEIIRAANRKCAAGQTVASGEVRPTDAAAVICPNRRRELTAFPMRWGYHTRDGGLIINARSETAAEKPMFREGMAARRCLMPMSAYFEWQARDRERTRFRIEADARELCCLAGIYRFEDGAPVFCVLTRQPDEGIAHIHNRMPVIVRYADRAAYLLENRMPAAPDVFAREG